jgi:hypothetical protein
MDNLKVLVVAEPDTLSGLSIGRGLNRRERR